MIARVRRILPAAALAVALVPTLAGCGSDEDPTGSPTTSVPALQARLDAVDRAVAAQDYGAARTAVRRLVRTASAGERSGDLDHADAAAIASAAEGLVAALREQQAPSSPATSATPTPSPTPTEEHTEAPPPPGHEEHQKPPKPPKPPKGPKPKPDHGPGHGLGHH